MSGALMLPDVWPELVGTLLGHVLGICLWSLIVYAPVLQWRSRRLTGWTLSYKDAYLVSIKAGLLAVFLGDGVAITLVGVGISEWVVAASLGSFASLGAWFFVHSNGLLMQPGLHYLIALGDARPLSISAPSFTLGISIGVGLTFVNISLLIKILT